MKQRLTFFARLLAAGLAALLVLGLLAQVTRDRWMVLAVLMHLPLLPLGLGAVAADGIWRGRALPWGRFGLGVLGVAGVGVGVWLGLGEGEAAASREGVPTVRVLHWNVQWGGGRGKTEANWGAMVEQIVREEADIVVLSETPEDKWLGMLAERMPGRQVPVTFRRVEHRYWFGLAVLSRWPVTLEHAEVMRSGAMMRVRVDHPGGAMRVLVVDGATAIDPPREELVADIVAQLRLAEGGVDLIAGDFNTVGRSAALDELRGEAWGYRFAAEAGRGWKGTWPSPCPLYDIDHVLAGRRVGVTGHRTMGWSHSDHLGQVADIQILR